MLSPRIKHKKGMLRNMQKINDYLTEHEVTTLKHDFGIVFEDVMTDEAFDQVFDKMIEIETGEVQTNDSATNKKLTKIADFITKITTSEKW